MEPAGEGSWLLLIHHTRQAPIVAERILGGPEPNLPNLSILVGRERKERARICFVDFVRALSQRRYLTPHQMATGQQVHQDQPVHHVLRIEVDHCVEEHESDETELGVGADAADQCVEQRQLLVELGVEHELEEYSP
jgi:hypothetical protein